MSGHWLSSKLCSLQGALLGKGSQPHRRSEGVIFDLQSFLRACSGIESLCHCMILAMSGNALTTQKLTGIVFHLSFFCQKLRTVTSLEYCCYSLNRQRAQDKAGFGTNFFLKDKRAKIRITLSLSPMHLDADCSSSLRDLFKPQTSHIPAEAAQTHPTGLPHNVIYFMRKHNTLLPSPLHNPAGERESRRITSLQSAN